MINFDIVSILLFVEEKTTQYSKVKRNKSRVVSKTQDSLIKSNLDPFCKDSYRVHDKPEAFTDNQWYDSQ